MDILKRAGFRVTVPSDLSVECHYESMEDELTCPVCLELYADPLMLPCSHSICKKCIQDIVDSKTKRKRSKKDTIHIECPSCRKEVQIGKDKLSALPRNLALENIVIRYTEERSKSIRESLSAVQQQPQYPQRQPQREDDVVLSPVLDSDGKHLPGTSSGGSTTHNALCELCDHQTSHGQDTLGAGAVAVNPAAWYCGQCQVGYCHACFAKYHPRKGALARHKVQPHSEGALPEKPVMCEEHGEEEAMLFCDACQVMVCPLCLCEGHGQHGGHKMLTPQTAATRIKESLKKTKEESDWLVASAMERKGKVEARAEEIKELHEKSRNRVAQQYERLLADITLALQQERDSTLCELVTTKDKALTQIQTLATDSDSITHKVESLAAACHSLTVNKHVNDTLSHAKEVKPLVDKLKAFQKQSEDMTSHYDATIKDKSAKLSLQSSVSKFGNTAVKLLQAMVDPCMESSTSFVPRILTPAATSGSIRSSTADLAPRMLNKCLITWGFSSTTFTGERLSLGDADGGGRGTATWTITLEKNIGGGGGGGGGSGGGNGMSNGYVFGVGVASEVLNVKDCVGMTAKSHGVVLNMGALCFANAAKMDVIEKLDAVPISVTFSVNVSGDYVVITYKIEGQGLSLLGKRVIRDKALKKDIFPVFTVSQRVKLLFPTCV